MRELLFLVHRLPYPPNKGDKIRSWHMLQYLSRHFRVHLGCFIDDAADWQHTRQVADLCASTRFIDLPPLSARWRAVQALLARQSMSVQYYRDERMLEWVAGVLSTGRVLEHWHTGSMSRRTRVLDALELLARFTAELVPKDPAVDVRTSVEEGKNAAKLIRNLYNMYWDTDAAMVEVAKGANSAGVQHAICS